MLLVYRRNPIFYRKQLFKNRKKASPNDEALNLTHSMEQVAKNRDVPDKH